MADFVPPDIATERSSDEGVLWTLGICHLVCSDVLSSWGWSGRSLANIMSRKIVVTKSLQQLFKNRMGLKHGRYCFYAMLDVMFSDTSEVSIHIEPRRPGVYGFVNPQAKTSVESLHIIDDNIFYIFLKMERVALNTVHSLLRCSWIKSPEATIYRELFMLSLTRGHSGKLGFNLLM